MNLKNVIFISFLILICIGVFFKWIENGSKVKSYSELENAINEYVTNEIFVTRLNNPELNRLYDNDTTIENRLFNLMIGEPLSFTKGIGKEYLSNCTKLLNEKYGKNIRGININKAIDENYTNVYFFNDDPKGYFVNFRDNCAYTKHKNIIICDINYVSNFQFVNSISEKLKDTIGIDAEFKESYLSSNSRYGSQATDKEEDVPLIKNGTWKSPEASVTTAYIACAEGVMRIWRTTAPRTPQ